MSELSTSQSTPVQIKQAIAEYVQKIASDPQPAEVHANLGALYVQQKQWKKAQAAYQQAVEIDPQLAAAYLNLAKIWEQLGDLHKVADNLFLALKLKPHAASAQQHYDLAKSLESQNKPGKAIASYHRAINIKPDWLTAYHALAALLIQQGKNDRATAIYRQGVNLNPQNPHFHLALGQRLATEEKLFQALKCYQTSIELDSNLAEGYCYWGKILGQTQKYAQAQKLYQQALTLREDYWEAHYQLGLLWQEQEKWYKAIAAYQKACQFNPQCAMASLKMAAIYRHLQQYDLAVDFYQKGINQSPPESSQEAKAIADYQQTVEEHPQKTAVLYYQLGRLLRAKGRFPDAIAAYQKSLELNPNYHNVYIDLQYTSISAAQLSDLIRFYRQIVSNNPQITTAWGNLGDALTQQNQVTEAIDCYRTCCYQQAIQTYPHLAELDWQEKKECAPDFIIAGASKSGTSSIYHYLKHHPQILFPHKKEIDFYWKNYDRGIDWYLAHFPTITDRPDFLTGEATPNYLRFPQVAQRIKDTFPQVKIIILLRNPVDRAISWHYHKLNSGLTNQNLATAIADEIDRLSTVSEAEIINTGFYNPDNIMSSLYIYKIKAWFEILGREQFLILKSEEFYLNPQAVMAKVFDFLGLSNCPLKYYPKVNSGSYKQINPNLRQTLADYFAPYNQQLEEYLDMEFNWK